MSEPDSVRPCERVLVIDDDPDMLASMKDVLEFGGATVATATSAREAESLLGDGFSPSVIVLDLRLGGDETGDALAERLKNDERLGEIPIVAMSGDASFLRRIDKGIVDAKLRKPFDLQHLFETLQQLCA